MRIVSVYNAASQLTSLTYKNGATVLGDLTYTYDAAGNRVQVGGAFARTTMGLGTRCFIFLRVA